MSWDFSYASASYLSAGDLTDLDGLAALSVHIWARLEGDTGDRHAVGKHDGSNGLRLYFDLTATNGHTRAPKLLMTIGGTSVRAEPSVDDLFTADEWHSFGGSWEPDDAAGVKVAFDGEIVGTGSSTAHSSGTTFPNLAADLYVGRQAASPAASWDGQLGPVALWDEVLDADDWAALAAGVPPTSVRPWALVFYSAMNSGAANEWFWRPQADAVDDFTHSGVSAADDDYPIAQEEDEDANDFAAGGTSWSSWSLVKDNLTESQWTDTDVLNGTEYEYKVRAVDESGNASDDSSAVSVTPAAGTAGDPLPPRRNLRSGLIARKRRSLR